MPPRSWRRRTRLAWLQDRHLLFYLALAEEAEPWLKSGKREPWLAMLDRETGNLRAALAWSASGHGAPDAGLRLAGALYWFWRFRGYLQEGQQWLAQVLAGAPAGPASALPRARALLAAGIAGRVCQSEGAGARELLLESVTLARAAGPAGRETLSQGLSWLSHFVASSMDEQAARSYGEESLALTQAGDNPWDIAWVYSTIGGVCYDAGDVSGAYRYYEESLELFRRLADPRSASWVLGSLGHLATRQGDYATARRHLEEGAAMSRQLGDRYNLAFALGYLGEVAFAEGAYEEDAGLLDECIELFRDLGSSTPLRVARITAAWSQCAWAITREPRGCSRRACSTCAGWTMRRACWAAWSASLALPWRRTSCRAPHACSAQSPPCSGRPAATCTTTWRQDSPTTAPWRPSVRRWSSRSGPKPGRVGQAMSLADAVAYALDERERIGTPISATLPLMLVHARLESAHT